MKDRQSVKIDQVTIVGGTHGNEFLGSYFIEKINQTGLYSDKPVNVQTLLANPDAFAKGVRFIDDDLNRSFAEERLSSNSGSIEIQRAQVIKKLFVASDQEQFVIDLHSTTANMGITLIVRDNDPFNLHAASYVQQQMPRVRILMSDSEKQHQTLNSISQWGLTIEVGPIANSVLRQDLFDATEKTVNQLIRFLSLCKTRKKPRLPETVDVFKVFEKIPYPKQPSGALAGMVHQDFQDKDYHLLTSGAAIFQTLKGEDITYQGKPGYPVFINEAAYYREDVAFMLTERITLPLSSTSKS